MRWIAGFAGTVSVQSLLLDNTIYIPSDESWIVHGTVGSNGLPVTLDSRFESGSYTQISHANLVFRYFRITGQMAPLDLDVAARTYSKRQVTSNPHSITCHHHPCHHVIIPVKGPTSSPLSSPCHHPCQRSR